MRASARTRISHPGLILSVMTTAVLVTAAPCARLVSTAGAQHAHLGVEPNVLDLGAFNGYSHTQTEPSVSHPGVEITSESGWELHCIALGPPRRLVDGLELPLIQRLEASYPDFPAALYSYDTFRLYSGSGSPDTQYFDVPDHLMAAILQEQLEETDPPGRYRMDVRLQLTDYRGNVLSDAKHASLQFEVEPWVQLEMLDEPTEIHANTGFLPAYTDRPSVVVIRGNSAWQLWAHCGGDLVNLSGSNVIPANNLALSLRGPGTGQWESHLSGRQPLGPQPAIVAEGGTPQPFTSVLAEVVLDYSVELSAFDEGAPIGRYHSTVDFSVAPVRVSF